MILGICALCFEQKTLQKSHVLPNAVFRKIKKDQRSGQLIKLDDSDYMPAHYSQDSWWEYMLCTDCEQLIGGYENYGLSLLRGTNRKKTIRHTDGVTFRLHDYGRFKLFLTSLLWRAAVSKQSQFSKVILPGRCVEEARSSLRSSRPLGQLRLGVKISRLIDSTNVADNGFSAEHLEQFIISPVPRLNDGRAYYTFLFLIEGFLLEYFVRAIPFKRAQEKGVHKKSPTLFVPHISIFDVPELVNLLTSAFKKSP